MHELEASSDRRQAFAIDYFVYRVGLNGGDVERQRSAALMRSRSQPVLARIPP